jgi:FkbM family methyltransferase
MKFYSQFNQDEIIYNLFFKEKKNGFFLEIGADDGIRFSNCKFFEETLNWNGIAIEARKDAYNKLIKNRNCFCENCVLSDIEEETQFLDIKGYGLGLSGLINKYDKRHIHRIKNEIKNKENKGSEVLNVTTQKLSSILDKYNITNIDFLSIDTEGSELDILSTIDFKKYNIDVITIEDNYNNPKLMEFFIKRGYTFIQQIKCDKLFKKINL